ncbi:ADP-ribosyl cyclase/cyclic ADP-ribose hydrolase 1 [Nibea albiflora]|uniref:ADP-ribosyl cyclase/cyclic ADP-ribose hydrolase 1 n=1 Tax=Nibea albiflora TaxID=240163 RepID=A0ACB7F6N3_NIBAL|nr:ADP-ribosyl cyclase/cyclic ADP-ribose hydrolase 1 [Nibea albiflora]
MESNVPLQARREQVELGASPVQRPPENRQKKKVAVASGVGIVMLGTVSTVLAVTLSNDRFSTIFLDSCKKLGGGYDCQKLWRAFEQAYVGRDPCQVPMEAYDPFIAEAHFKPACNRFGEAACGDVTVMLNGSIVTPFSPESIFASIEAPRLNSSRVKKLNVVLVTQPKSVANCETASLKDLQKELDKGITYNCKEVPETGCEQILDVFEQAYVGKPSCNVSMSAYDPLMTAVPLIHSCNKTMFWSETKDLVHVYTSKNKDCFTLEDTLLGYCLDDLTWCGKEGSNETFTSDCPGWEDCEKNPVRSFWTRASAGTMFWSKTAKLVHGYTSENKDCFTLEDTLLGYCLDGRTWCGKEGSDETFTSDCPNWEDCVKNPVRSFWTRASEVHLDEENCSPNMNLKVIIGVVAAVAAVTIIVGVTLGVVLNPPRGFSDEFMERCQNFTKGNITGCEQILDVFEQAYVGKDDCSVPMSAYDPLMKAVPFTYPCGRTMFWSKTNNLVHEYTEKNTDCFAMEETLLGYCLNGLTWCGKEGSSETFTSGCPNRKDCVENPVSSFWDRASAGFADHACDEVSVMLDGSLEKPFDPNRPDCKQTSKLFEQAYVGKPSCNVPMSAYDPLMKAAPFTHSCGKSMLWSKTAKLVHEYTKKNKDCFTLEDTLLGYCLNGLTWCGKEGSSETFTSGCPKWDKCVKNPVRSFWTRASEGFADHACGEVSVMLDGSLEKPFDPNSVFATIEIKRLRAPKVKKLNVILVSGEKSNCNSPNLKKDLRKALDLNVKYSCKEVKKPDCKQTSKLFEQAYVGKDDCSVPVTTYNALMKAAPFTHPCGKSMLWSKTANVVHEYTKKNKDCFAMEDTLLGYCLDGQMWCGKKGSSETFTSGCPKWGDCVKNPVRSFWTRASEVFADHACDEVSVMLDGSQQKPFDPNRLRCEQILDVFEQAYVGKDDCSVPMSAYDPLMKALTFIHPCSRTMFWSKTNNLVHEYTKKNTDCFTLEETLLGYCLDGLTWCGKEGSNETFTSGCREWRDPGCEENPVSSFWTRASEGFADHACDEVSVMLDGSLEKPFNHTSTFATIEIKRFKFPKVKKLNVILVSGGNCSRRCDLTGPGEGIPACDWTTRGFDTSRSVHENTMHIPPVERSQAGEAVTTDRKQTYRLYPSLPDKDRYDAFVSDQSFGEKPHTAAVHHQGSLLGESESPAANSAVRMKAQILILEEQRQELLSINERWAKEYRTMKQYYKEKVQDLRALLQHPNFEEDMWEEREKNIRLRNKVEDAESTWTKDVELLRAVKEAKELREQNSTLTRRGQHQREEIRRLNKAEVYKEDFLKERKDREKLKEKYLELEKKFRKVYNELRVLKPQVTRTRPPQPVVECTCTIRAKCPNWEVRPVHQHDVQFQRRYTLDNKLVK